MKLHILTESGKTIDIITSKNEEIKKLKKEIFEKEKIHILNQKIICNGHPLPDEASIGYFGDNPKVFLELKEVDKIPIYINFMSGKEVIIF